MIFKTVLKCLSSWMNSQLSAVEKNLITCTYIEQKVQIILLIQNWIISALVIPVVFIQYVLGPIDGKSTFFYLFTI